jgi:serine/threonine protein kinase/WD40 repeat protein
MDNDSHQDRIDELFDRAIALPADEREAFLNVNCNGDAEVLAAVQKMLAAHDRAERATEFLAEPPEDLRFFADDDQRKHPLVGQRVGPYEVKRWLGGGGFGHVYLAFRSDDYQQKVAVKVLRSDIDVDSRVLARFELERQLLADLQHEHIARLLYGGTLDTGRPYIVMEYVKGKPITEYCDAKKLSIADRLALFRQVCEAVAFAHRYGAIHRDIKPGNIFVTEEGSVKLLDFGIAKMVDPISQRRIVTISQGGQPLTPEYASPEQVRNEGISTASDVYSLGVVLYELLTGRRPYELHDLPWHEAVRVISEVEPRKPSTVVLEPVRIRREDGTGDIRSAETIAEPRGADPQKLNRTLKGDLEQIALKALRKDARERYLTVEELIDDLDRFAQSRPVKARPVNRLARSLRWSKRNPAATVAIVITSIAAISLLTGALTFAAQQRNLANARTVLARNKELARLDAESKLYRALIGRASAARTARKPGYRAEVWNCLHEAAALNVPERNMDEIKDQVLACLGDPIGLLPDKPPVVSNDQVELPSVFAEIVRTRSQKEVEYSMSDDGQYLATADYQDNYVIARLWGKDGKKLSERASDLSYIRDIAFSSTGHLLVLGCEQGFMILSLPSLDVRATIYGNVTEDVATQPNGDLMAALVGFRGETEIWSLASNRLVTSFIAPKGVELIDFDSDGQMLLGFASDRDKVIAAWRVGDTREKKQLRGHEEGVAGMAFSPDGKFLATGSKDQTVRIWEVSTGHLLHVCRGHKHEIETVNFSSDGQLLASGDWHGELIVWDPQSGKRLCEAQNGNGIWDVQFDPSSQYLVTGGQISTACWEIKRNDDSLALLPITSVKIPIVLSVAINPNSLGYAALTWDNRLLWNDLTENRDPVILDDQLAKGGVDALQFDRQGKVLHFATRRGTLRSVDVVTRQAVHETSNLSLASFAITADGHWAAINSSTVYDLQMNCTLFTLPPEANGVWDTRWSPDGTKLALGTPNGLVGIWNIDEVRARLAEFGIKVPSTAVKLNDQPRAPRLNKSQFEQLKSAQKKSP